MIPDAQYNVLVGLASGETPEEVWAEVSQYAPEEEVDTSNVVKAMERTPGRVVFVAGNDELERILEHPFAKWRIFLHPAQRKIAYAQRYSGPAQVTGGAGTGKTVTATHRAAFLAGRTATGPLAVPRSAASVLMTTFTRNLADALETQFELLVESDQVRKQVEVLNVDRLAYRVVEQARGGRSVTISNCHAWMRRSFVAWWLTSGRRAVTPLMSRSSARQRTSPGLLPRRSARSRTRPAAGRSCSGWTRAAV